MSSNILVYLSLRYKKKTLLLLIPQRFLKRSRLYSGAQQV